MRKALHYLMASVGVSVLLSTSASFADSPSAIPAPQITVESKDEDGKDFKWGPSPEQIGGVLRLVANQLLPYFPGRKLSNIIVRHQDNNPATRFARGPNGEYLVFLSANREDWAKFSYQFAHELGHIVSNEIDYGAGVIARNNAWFGEAISDTASMFVLSRMKRAWENEYATRLDMWFWRERFEPYLNQYLVDPWRRLPPDRTMAHWIFETLPVLVHERDLTERSELVASYLLPLFQKTPEGWEALNWLGIGKDDGKLEFKVYLQAWHDRVPIEKGKQREFIRQIQALFGFVPQNGSSAAPTRPVSPAAQ